MTSLSILSTIAYKVNDFFSQYWKRWVFVILCLSYKAVYSQNNVENQGELFLGEELSYDVKYSFIPVGEAQLRIDSLLQYPDGKPHYLVSIEVKSVGLLKFLYSDLLLEYETYISIENHSHVLKTSRKLKHGKKYDEDYDFFSYQDSLYIKTQSINKNRIRTNAYSNKQDNIRDVLGTYFWYRSQDMSMLEQADTSFFYLANKANMLVVQPTLEVEEFENEEAMKFSLLFPGVADMPQDKEHSVLVSKKSGIPLKIKISMDVGNFYFTSVRKK